MTTHRTPAIPAELLVALEIRRHLKWESEGLAERAFALAQEVLGPGSERLSNTQVNGLLSVANTAGEVNDVRKFVRHRATRDDWRKAKLAEPLVQAIDALRRDAQRLREEITSAVRTRFSMPDAELKTLIDNNQRRNEIHYLLVREFIQSFAINYLYSIEGRGQSRSPQAEEDNASP